MRRISLPALHRAGARASHEQQILKIPSPTPRLAPPLHRCLSALAAGGAGGGVDCCIGSEFAMPNGGAVAPPSAAPLRRPRTSSFFTPRRLPSPTCVVVVQ